MSTPEKKEIVPSKQSFQQLTLNFKGKSVSTNLTYTKNNFYMLSLLSKSHPFSYQALFLDDITNFNKNLRKSSFKLLLTTADLDIYFVFQEKTKINDIGKKVNIFLLELLFWLKPTNIFFYGTIGNKQHLTKQEGLLIDFNRLKIEKIIKEKSFSPVLSSTNKKHNIEGYDEFKIKSKAGSTDSHLQNDPLYLFIHFMGKNTETEQYFGISRKSKIWINNKISFQKIIEQVYSFNEIYLQNKRESSTLTLFTIPTFPHKLSELQLEYFYIDENLRANEYNILEHYPEIEKISLELAEDPSETLKFALTVFYEGMEIFQCNFRNFRQAAEGGQFKNKSSKLDKKTCSVFLEHLYIYHKEKGFIKNFQIFDIDFKFNPNHIDYSPQHSSEKGKLGTTQKQKGNIDLMIRYIDENFYHLEHKKPNPANQPKQFSYNSIQQIASQTESIFGDLIIYFLKTFKAKSLPFKILIMDNLFTWKGEVADFVILIDLDKHNSKHIEYLKRFIPQESFSSHKSEVIKLCQLIHCKSGPVTKTKDLSGSGSSLYELVGQLVKSNHYFFNKEKLLEELKKFRNTYNIGYDIASFFGNEEIIYQQILACPNLDVQEGTIPTICYSTQKLLKDNNQYFNILTGKLPKY